ncbi:AMP-binding protein [Micromonospora sp. NPDC051925]|uniref:non-ribosomal peptide synthetase n=1 Tax=Micromonospora sp. NPDC051925 TaxID=3364288 RepID=UPI0037C94A12
MTSPSATKQAEPGMPYHHPNVLERWQRAAERASTKPACRDNAHARSHQELLDLARRRAALLLAGGLRGEQRVVVMLHDGIDHVTWVAAVMLAGGCAVPIAVDQPRERLRELVRLARPAVVVVDDNTAPLAEDERCYDGAHAGLGDVGDLPMIHHEQAAYLCFTSGTTGRPKGAIVNHGVLAHTTAEMSAYLALEQRPRLHVLTTSWSFDVSMMDLWLTLTTGGTLYLPNRADLLGPALIDTVCDLEAPILHGVPSLFAAFTEADVARLPSGTTVMLGGESVPAGLLGQLRLHTDMHAVYGITETGVVTTTHRVTADTTPDVIGRALPGTDCVVVDETGCPVPDGTTGELLIGGAAVGRGYLGDPTGTAARFVPAADGTRRYRTGDLVHRTPEGVYFFHGRIDHQIKVRGHRLEPAEVEQKLLAVAGVHRTAVQAVRNPAGEQTVVAYVSGTGLSVDGLREAAAARMPTWMRPGHFEILPTLPITATGKIDRRNLPDPVWPIAAAAGDPAAAPRSDAEAIVGDLWAQLLGTPHVGADDDFVALGGHSLKAAQLSTALRDRLGVPVPVTDLLNAGSLREMADLVDRAVRLGPAGEHPTVAATTSVTADQRQVWLQQQLAGPAGIYNLVVTVDMHGTVHTTALQRALHAVERRHPALRTRFVFEEDDLVTVVGTSEARPLIIRTADVAEEVRRAGRYALDVSAEPPWRYELLADGNQRHVLLLVFHHLAVDGLSVYGILEEVADEYSIAVEPGRGRRIRDEANQVPPRPEGDEHDDLEFWRAMAQDAPEPVLLAGQRSGGGGDVADFAGWCRPVTIEGVDPEQLRRAAAARGGTMQAAALSSLLRVMALESDTTDLILGIPFSRRGVDVEPTAIGQFVSNLPLRFQLPQDLAPTACMTAVTRTLRLARRHSSIDAEAIRNLVRPKRADGTADFFHVAFSWEDELPKPAFAGLDTSWELAFNGWSDVNLVVELSVRDGRLAGRVIGRQATGADVDVDRLGDALGRSLRAFLSEQTPAGGPV